MKAETRLAIRWSIAAASSVGCGIAGSRLWPKHPFAGGLIGVVIVAPVINSIVDAVLPAAAVAPVASEAPRANYAGAPGDSARVQRDSDANYINNARPQ